MSERLEIQTENATAQQKSCGQSFDWETSNIVRNLWTETASGLM